MKEKRPVNLQLTTIRFPITAISSILHRITGILLFLSLPILLWALEQSLSSQQGFDQVAKCFAGTFGKLILLGLIACVIYHFIAGIRHLLMDVGIGEEKCCGRISAKLVIVLSVILVIAAGIWIW